MKTGCLRHEKADLLKTAKNPREKMEMNCRSSL